MPLDVVYGESRDRTAAQALAQALREVVTDGTVYLGYPVLATADERVEVDALLVSSSHGLVAFLLPDSTPSGPDDWTDLIRDQDRLYSVLESHLGRHEALRRGRRLAIHPETATVFSVPVPPSEDVHEGTYIALHQVADWLRGLSGIDPDLERALHAALQRVSTIKPSKKRTKVTKASSRGAVLKVIEAGIANLDRWQKQAAIESPEGPQRIRGLAGSGKTVVLALKAAYWHAQNPDWRIAVTFASRALYQQFDDLITRFSFEHSNDKPDPDKLKVIHSWGSRGRAGVYSTIAHALGVEPLDFLTARKKYGMDAAFQGACAELLAVATTATHVPQLFDAVLIDEAQDLPPEFFQLVYLCTTEPKRIVWGYDELQRLSEAAMPSTDELFGTGPRGESRVTLQAAPDTPRRDIVLPVCYRNTPWALATAHALGIGVYRKGGLLQHPDDPTLWTEIGYNVVNGHLQAGAAVTLKRSTDSAPKYFAEQLVTDDAVVLQSFPDEAAQDLWVADQIATNISTDELEPDDILIVLPDTYRAKTRGPRLMKMLRERGIASHQVGVTTSADEVFRPDSVALAHIYRAKGNEAPMVYVVDAQHCATEFNAVTRRNILFTAITRSRAWVRICGHGDLVDVIVDEAQQVVDSQFQLKFRIPTDDELRRLRHLHRDRPAEQEASVRRNTSRLVSFLEAVDRGEMDVHDLPDDVQARLAQLQQELPGDDD
ncbi:DEAD/DEAH box helicase [Mobilicoccus caccae]|uniref:UvrD-like helicase C-terminal domain-containing protein n=1 Tax=Mobilicoccus caccae TaxID=1859295 RepID=A0ABQ6ITY5_9MICO|nr:ATP-binding domain-containing protein [Mobilicoccus caccae]GMA40192.1 hypothetical protein GCM10025883_22370 [Mobilicoccus caccae]